MHAIPTGFEPVEEPVNVLGLLKRIPWFHDLKPEQLDRLTSITTTTQLKTGEALFQEGDREGCLYVVLDGQLEVTSLVPTKGIVRIYVAEPLDVLGWSTLTPVVRQRTSGVTALEPSTLLCFDGDGLRSLCDSDHELGYVIYRRIANEAASRMLAFRVRLLDLIVRDAEERVSA